MKLLSSAVRTFRVHARVFTAGVAVLTLANWLSGSPWWSFWPIAAWSIVFGVHYLVYKARTTDERWAEERTAELHSKSYDVSHIDRISSDKGRTGELSAEKEPKP
jgi:hypothetical protein